MDPPEHCLVSGGVPLFRCGKSHASNGCNMYLLRSPAKHGPKLENLLKVRSGRFALDPTSSGSPLRELRYHDFLGGPQS